MTDTIERMVAETVEPPEPDHQEIGCVEHRSGDALLCPVADVTVSRRASGVAVTVDGDEWIRSGVVVDVPGVR